jgi:hypothetical protein
MRASGTVRAIGLFGMTLWLLSAAMHAEARPNPLPEPFLQGPIWAYNNWSAYDELSDTVPLTESLAMRELDEILRLRKAGVRVDYYVMDAFWYDPDGGYRRWRDADWPQGPGRWLEALQANGIKPGLWFSTNTLTHMNAVSQWQDSLDEAGTAMSLTTGGFLADFMDVLQYWYDRGIRLFKFDMANFDAVARSAKGKVTPQAARIANLRAFHEALLAFRNHNPDVVLIGFNGIVGDVGSETAPVAWFNGRWLDTLDTFYSGDPRPSNVPEMDFWRSVDIYADNMVRSFEQAGIPPERIDSTSFMIGNTGTNYHRGLAEWQASALLMMAHGGWINTIHGSLELIDDAKARWLAKAQSLYAPLQQHGLTKPFGGIPGDAYPYGFGSVDLDGALYAVVNPSQRVRMVRMPQLSPQQPRPQHGRILFRDAGLDPTLANESITLGPGQFALVGFGRYADPANDLGTGVNAPIPRSIRSLQIHFSRVAEKDEPEPSSTAIEAIVIPPSDGDLRIVLRRRNAHDKPSRAFAPHENFGDFFTIEASQDGHALPVAKNYDKVIWSGLAWAVGEIRHGDIRPGKPIELKLSTPDRDPSIHLTGEVFSVEY